MRAKTGSSEWLMSPKTKATCSFFVSGNSNPTILNSPNSVGKLAWATSSIFAITCPYFVLILFLLPGSGDKIEAQFYLWL